MLGLSNAGPNAPDTFRYHVIITRSQLAQRRLYLREVAQGGAFEFLWRIDPNKNGKTVAQAVADWVLAGPARKVQYIQAIQLAAPTAQDQWKAYFKGWLVDQLGQGNRTDPMGAPIVQGTHAPLIAAFGDEIVRRDVFWSYGQFGNRDLFGAAGNVLHANFFPKDYADSLNNQVAQRMSAQEVLLDCLCRQVDDPNEVGYLVGGVAARYQQWRELCLGLLGRVFNDVADTNTHAITMPNGTLYNAGNLGQLLTDLEAVL